MQKLNFGKTNNKELESNYLKALKDNNFKKIANSLDIDDKIKYRYTTSLQELANNLDTCSKCKGLSNCPYEIPGLIKCAYVDHNIIKFAYKECKYKEKNEIDNEYQKNVFSNHLPKEI